jgi:membrane protease YdiL (CAAX protease family)
MFRGFLFERLGKLFGQRILAKISIVLLTSAFFALVHYHDQRLVGTEQAAIVGLIFGSIFAIPGRIFMLMTAHAAFDLTRNRDYILGP